MNTSENTLDLKQQLAQRKKRISKISIIAILSLIVLKAIAAVLTGSVGIRADAIHSIIDLTGAVIGFIAIRFAQKPSDDNHTYGHGKAENVAGLIIAGIIFLAAGTIIYEAVHRLVTGAEIEMVTVGIIVTVCAIGINSFISWYAMKTAKMTDSIALEATARDMMADVYSSCAVLVGLILVAVTGITILDTIVAIVVGVLIIKAALETLKRSLAGLIDESLPAEEQELISNCIKKYGGEFVEVHGLRTRKSGGDRFIDFHITVPHTLSVTEAHALCDNIQTDIQSELPMSNATIHIDPCNTTCHACGMTCTRLAGSSD